MNLYAMKDMLAVAEQEGKSLWEIVLETDMERREVSARESMEKMAETWHAMLLASETYTGELHSSSGLAGGQGLQMREYAAAHETIGGGFTAEVIA